MRRLRIAAPAQLSLGIDTGLLDPAQRWWLLSEEARVATIAILARMITAGVVESEEEGAGDEPDQR